MIINVITIMNQSRRKPPEYPERGPHWGERYYSERATRKQKDPMQVKRLMKMKGPTEVKGPHRWTLRMVAVKTFSLANLSPGLPLSKWLRHLWMQYIVTGAALLENNEASAKLTTANGGTFTSSSARLSNQSRCSTLDQWLTCFAAIGYCDWLNST